jgi:hypothetical protein
MTISTYYIDKASQTFADNLAAFGLAYVLNALADGRAEVQLEDQGSVFAVTCEPALQPEWVAQRAFFVGAPFLVTYDRKTQGKAIKGTAMSLSELPEQGGDTVVDYEVEKAANAVYFDWRKTLSPDERKRVASGELIGPPAPHPNWDLFRAVNPAALQGYNALMVEWWRGHADFAPLVQALLQMVSQTPNDLDGAEAIWAKHCKAHGLPKPKDATALQLVNPIQGKGVNSPKAEWREPNNVKGFWLLEWLKVVGLFYGSVTRVVQNPQDPRNAKDRKTYVLVPVHLAWSVHGRVMSEFRQAMLGSATPIKLDILVTLRYTLAFLRHYEGARAEDLAADLWGQRPSDLVSGMQMAFYKSLGQSPAVMNIATLNLPRWVAPHDAASLATMQTALDEHLRIIQSLDETRGDQLDLLASYRDFLSANDLDPFFEFTTAYSGFIMSQYERRKYVRPFTTTTLEVLFMNSDKPGLSRIVQDEGFRNIARAIRQATITAQYRKANKEKFLVRYEVRYGLGQQLARKAAYPNEFVAELTAFLHLYNAENSQMQENLNSRYQGRIPEGVRRQMRRSVKVGDIDAILSLLDEYQDPRLICNLLVAYGYAREPFEKYDDEPSPQMDPLCGEGETDDNETIED